jgi:hypothetical protein
LDRWTELDRLNGLCAHIRSHRRQGWTEAVPLLWINIPGRIYCHSFICRAEIPTDRLVGMHIYNNRIDFRDSASGKPGLRYRSGRDVIRILWRQLPMLAGMFVGIVSQSTSTLQLKANAVEVQQKFCPCKSEKRDSRLVTAGTGSSNS